MYPRKYLLNCKSCHVKVSSTDDRSRAYGFVRLLNKINHTDSGWPRHFDNHKRACHFVNRPQNANIYTGILIHFYMSSLTIDLPIWINDKLIIHNLIQQHCYDIWVRHYTFFLHLKFKFLFFCYSFIRQNAHSHLNNNLKNQYTLWCYSNSNPYLF